MSKYKFKGIAHIRNYSIVSFICHFYWYLIPIILGVYRIFPPIYYSLQDHIKKLENKWKKASLKGKYTLKESANGYDHLNSFLYVWICKMWFVFVFVILHCFCYVIVSLFSTKESNIPFVSLSLFWYCRSDNNGCC